MYNSLGKEIEDFVLERDSKNYSGCKFKLENQKIIFRQANVTPIKQGGFVTLWKRPHKEIEPYHIDDEFDYLHVFIQTDSKRGIFIFPKQVLQDNFYISDNKNEGRRGFRLYPSWEKNLNKSAMKSQIWQVNHFTQLS